MILQSIVAAVLAGTIALTPAAAADNAEVYIGAFGSGIAQLDSSGAFTPIESPTNPLTMTADRFGNLYVGDFDRPGIIRISPDGTETVIDVPAQDQMTTHPVTGDLYASINGSIYRYGISSQGWEWTGMQGWWDRGELAIGVDGTTYTASGVVWKQAPGQQSPTVLSTTLNSTYIAVDDSGNVFVDALNQDTRDRSVVRIAPDGTETTVHSGAVDGIETDAAGNVYLSHRYSHTITKIAPDGHTHQINTYPLDPTLIAVGQPAP